MAVFTISGGTMKKTFITASAVIALIATPVVFAQQGGRITFESLDANEDGKVTLEEFKENFNPPTRGDRTLDPDAIFARLDVDADGILTEEEFANRRQGQRQQ